MNNGTYLNKIEILAADDLKFQDVSVPEWGGTVRIREMSVGDREHLSALYKKREDDETASSYLAVLVALSVVDKDGNRLFADADIPSLEKKSLPTLQAISEAAMALNGISIKAKDEAVKNSEASPSADSPSA